MKKDVAGVSGEILARRRQHQSSRMAPYEELDLEKFLHLGDGGRDRSG